MRMNRVSVRKAVGAAVPAMMVILLGGCMAEESPGPAPAAGDRLAAELENHVRDGPPVNCVRSRDVRGNRTVGEDVILFTGTGGRAWVNRTRGSCPSLTSGRALRFQNTGGQFCQNDIAAVYDPSLGIEYGSCSLGVFEPYRRR